MGKVILGESFTRTDTLEKFDGGEAVDESEFYDIIAVTDDETFTLLDYLRAGGYIREDDPQTFLDDF